MTKKKKYLILGVFSFLFAIHCILFFLNGYAWKGIITQLPFLFIYLLFFMSGVGCFLRSIFLLSDRRILETAQKETALKKGGRIAVRGTISPGKAQLSAPFSGKPCVLYEYRIFREISQRNSYHPEYHPEAAGWAFVPSSVKTENGPVSLSDYPILMVSDFWEEEKIGKYVTPQFIRQIRFKRPVMSFLLREVVALIPSLSLLLFSEPPGKDGVIRADIDYTGKKGDFCADKIDERVVSPGTPVIAIGTYDPKRNALVSDRIGLRLIHAESDLKEIRESFRGEIIIFMTGGIFFTGCWLFFFNILEIWYLFSGLFITNIYR